MKTIAISTLTLLLASAPAYAADGWIVVDDGTYDRPMHLSALGALDVGVAGLGLAIGGALWFSVPIVHDGFIPSLNESFEIVGGANFTKAINNVGFDLSPMIGVKWTFFLREEFAAYFTLKGGIAIRKPVHSSLSVGYHFAADAAVGVYYKITDNFHLNAEAGAYNLIRAGASFSF